MFRDHWCTHQWSRNMMLVEVMRTVLKTVFMGEVCGLLGKQEQRWQFLALNSKSEGAIWIFHPYWLKKLTYRQTVLSWHGTGGRCEGMCRNMAAVNTRCVSSLEISELPRFVQTETCVSCSDLNHQLQTVNGELKTANIVISLLSEVLTVNKPGSWSQCSVFQR
jgi:hypothetical protein